jgi:hypothetical protein
VHETSRAFLAKLPHSLPTLRNTGWKIVSEWAHDVLDTDAPPAFLFLLFDLFDESTTSVRARKLASVGLLVCDMSAHHAVLDCTARWEEETPRDSPPRPPAAAAAALRSAASSPSTDGSPTLLRPPLGRSSAGVAAHSPPGPAQRLACAWDTGVTSTPTTRRKERPADAETPAGTGGPPAGAGAGLFGDATEQPATASNAQKGDGAADSSDAGSVVPSSLTPVVDETLDASAIPPGGGGGGFGPVPADEEHQTVIYTPQEPMASQAVGSEASLEPRYHLLTHMSAETLDSFTPAPALSALAAAAAAVERSASTARRSERSPAPPCVAATNGATTMASGVCALLCL